MSPHPAPILHPSIPPESRFHWRRSRRTPSLRRLLSGSVALALAAVSSLPATETPSSPRTTPLELVEKGSITVDGRLNEAVYQSGAWINDFRRLSTTEPAPHQTRFRILSDGEALYLSAEVDEPTGEPLATVTGRDDEAGRGDKITVDDCVELIVRAGEDPSTFFQFLVNANAALVDIEYRQGGNLKNRAWNSSAQVATQRTATGWSLEFSVPLGELQVDPRLESWGLQVIRERPKTDAETAQKSSWSPVVLNGFRDPETFGVLALPPFERSLLGWTLSSETESIRQHRDGNHLRQPVRITNRTGKYRNVVLKSFLGADRKHPAVREFGLAAGKGITIETAIPLGQRKVYEGSIRHELAVSQAPGKTLALINQPISAEYHPAVLRLKTPGYRATLYETQKADAIRAELLQIDRDLSLTVQNVRVWTPDGPTLNGTAEPRGEHHWIITVPGVASLPFGEHRLEVIVNNGDGQQTLQRTFRKVPYQKGEMWINEKGIVHRDGKPFPAYGFIYGDWSNIESKKVPGVSMNIGYPVNIEQGRKTSFATVELLAAHGIHGGVDLRFVLDRKRNQTVGNTPLTKAERETLRRFARTVRPRTDVSIYYLEDEPEGSGIHPGRLREIYETVTKEDPYHPIVLINNSVTGTREYQEACDISSPNPYLLFLQNGGSARPMNRIGQFLDQLTTGSESYRAAWLTPQAFNYGFVSAENNRGPSAREMRSQQVIGLIHGATGLVWYPMYYAWDEPGVSTSLPYLSREFEALFPVLTESRPELLDIAEGLEVGWSQVGDIALLLIVNPEWKPRKATLKEARFATIPRWRKLGTREWLPGSKEEVTVELPPHGSTILASEGFSFPDDLDWTEVLEKETHLVTQSVIPGNVAHSSHGTKVTKTGKPIPQYLRPMLTINGFKHPLGRAYSDPFEPGDGVEIDFGTPRKLQQLVVIGSNIRTGHIELEEEGDWIRLDGVHFQPGAHEQKFTLPGKSIRRIRILADSVIEERNRIKILEIEAYE